MTVHMANVLFMGALAIFASVAAAVLAVLIDRWWNNRTWRKDLEDAEETAPLAVELIREDKDPRGA